MHIGNNTYPDKLITKFTWKNNQDISEKHQMLKQFKATVVEKN